MWVLPDWGRDLFIKEVIPEAMFGSIHPFSLGSILTAFEERSLGLHMSSFQAYSRSSF